MSEALRPWNFFISCRLSQHAIFVQCCLLHTTILFFSGGSLQIFLNVPVHAGIHTFSVLSDVVCTVTPLSLRVCVSNSLSDRKQNTGSEPMNDTKTIHILLSYFVVFFFYRITVSVQTLSWWHSENEG